MNQKEQVRFRRIQAALQNMSKAENLDRIAFSSATASLAQAIAHLRTSHVDDADTSIASAERAIRYANDK